MTTPSPREAADRIDPILRHADLTTAEVEAVRVLRDLGHAAGERLGRTDYLRGYRDGLDHARATDPAPEGDLAALAETIVQWAEDWWCPTEGAADMAADLAKRLAASPQPAATEGEAGAGDNRGPTFSTLDQYEAWVDGEHGAEAAGELRRALAAARDTGAITATEWQAFAYVPVGQGEDAALAAVAALLAASPQPASPGDGEEAEAATTFAVTVTDPPADLRRVLDCDGDEKRSPLDVARREVARLRDEALAIAHATDIDDDIAAEVRTIRAAVDGLDNQALACCIADAEQHPTEEGGVFAVAAAARLAQRYRLRFPVDWAAFGGPGADLLGGPDV